MILSEEQRAILEARGNIVVVAGAGTGKTETLTQRVLHTLTANEEYSLRELVVLTFTDKAAGEMRQRVYRGLLSRLLGESDDNARRRWSALCAGFAETHRIETFDAFNHRLLLAYPEYQLVPNAFSAMSDFDERQLQARMARELWGWLESLESEDPARADFFELLRDFDRKQILHLLNSLGGETVSTRQWLASLSNREIYLETLRELSKRFALQLNKREARRLNRLWSNFQNALQTQFPELPPILQETLRDSEQLVLRDSAVVTQSGTFRRNWIPKEYKEVCADLEERVFPILNQWQKAEKQLHETLQVFADPGQTAENDWQMREHLARAARLANWWAQKREEICRREGWLDFPSAQRAALSLLEDNEEVSHRLRAGCRFILVDEFQDTNFDQWRLVQAFSSPENVMLIGDGKQSIYGFRGGDITVLEEVQHNILHIESPHSLSLSQRATPVLTGFFNAVFKDVLPDETDPDRERWEAPFQELHSARSDDSPSGVYYLDAAPSDEILRPHDLGNLIVPLSQDGVSLSNAALPAQSFSMRAPSDAELLAETTALLLREIQDDADSGADLEDENALLNRAEFKSISAQLRQNKAAAVGILFSSHKAKALYESKLRQHGVRYSSVKGIDFYNVQPVSDAINLLRFFFDTRDDLALAGVLRAPFFGASDIALLELKRFALETGSASFWGALQARCEQEVVENCRLQNDDEIALQRACLQLSRWRMLAQTQSMSAVLEAVETETEIAFARELRGDAAQDRENWRKVLDIIRDREAAGQGSARALAEYFSEQAKSEEREADAEMPEGGAIQLMTVHAAKGLGFSMTIVAQMDGKFRFDQGLLRHGEIESRHEKWFALQVKDSDGKEQNNLLWEILKENERAQREAEWARLFYVACTRARDFLLLAMPQESKPGTWGAMAEPFLQDKPSFGLQALRARADQRATQMHDEAAAHAKAALPLPEINVELLRPFPENALGFEASVTQIVAPQNPFSQGVAQVSDAGSTPSIALGQTDNRRKHGTVFHQLMRANVDARAHARIASFASLSSLPDERAAILGFQLQAARDWLQSQNFEMTRAQHEVSFSVPAIALQGVLPSQGESPQWINGAIDLLVPRENEWAIIDFKTRSGQTTEMPQQYENQLRVYRAAMEFSGWRISACWLIFLDEDGGVIARRVE